MTRMEELLRAAIHDDAAELAPECIRPLNLRRAALPRRLPPRARLTRWHPLFAAAAVVAVVALSLTLAKVLPGGRHQPGPRPSPSKPAVVSTSTVPPYYVATSGAKPGKAAGSAPVVVTVRSTDTGVLLATVRPPAPFGTFTFVTGTGTPGTWLAGAQRWRPQRTIAGGWDNSAQPVVLFQLSFNGGTGKATMTRLPVPALPVPTLPVTQPVGAALSADRSRLALLMEAGGSGFELRVYPLHGGAVKTWTQPLSGKSTIAGTILDWLGDNTTLAMESGTATDVWFLDTTGPAGDLVTASRHVALQPGSVPPPAGQFHCDAIPVAVADGKTIICGGAIWRSGAGSPLATGIGVFSAATGRLISIRDKRTVASGHADGVGAPIVLWAGPGGGLLIGADLDGRPRMRDRVAMLTPDGRIVGIPVPGALLPILTRSALPMVTIAW
jgi:hypothetical protein